jgi:hypothetical protein
MPFSASSLPPSLLLPSKSATFLTTTVTRPPPPRSASVFNIHGYPSQDFPRLLAALLKH